MPTASASRLPLWLKLVVTAFVGVLVPVYYVNYGPTNFLYFCDVALLLCLISLWTEHARPASMAAVGILLPQVLWCADFLGELFGVHLVGLTSYMFDPNRSLFLRGLSFFHGWLPFLLLFLLQRLGYDRRALWSWTALGWGLCLVAFFLLPPAGAIMPDPKIPVNINYVFGFDDAKAQTWLPAPLYLLGWMATLLLVVYMPTHLLLRKVFAPALAVPAAPAAPAAVATPAHTPAYH
ncbi:membrane-associated protein [Hymenobacter monticola]|uniref:Membrane-associated protein n=1 Tax=Hymenobacter monticola TaxID=1705399 RepID=A0ABY4B8P7_9BACT|nr:membrane-associated protein [Hymenobacter monticola]UOE35523.1 membrane-associated protein [Hymenobacter monticola]